MKKTVLVVDDSPPMRFLLEAVLGERYKVYTAADGVTAIMWLSKGNMADIIITDIQMPHMDGWELIRYLSDNVLYEDIPLIVLSGSNVKEIPVELKLNITDIMTKPFDPNKLVDLVEKHMQAKLAIVGK